LRDHINPW